MRGRRLLALAAAVTVPAMAAPGEWQGLGNDNSGQVYNAQLVQPMAFEQAGHSFPGSAFFYLEDAPELLVDLPAIDPGVTVASGSVDAAPLLETHAAGPAARAFLSGGTGLDKARARQCLTAAIYYEAASESTAGQRAVAQVVLNRVAHPTYPNSICGVVYQGSQRSTGCQFSFTCDGSLTRKPSSAGWARAQRIAGDALSGTVFAPVGMATHYHTIWINPYWAGSLDHIGVIGAHRFYRWRGAAGRPAAFRASYRGQETIPAYSPNTREAPVASPAPDPVALARAYEDALAKAQAGRGAAPNQPIPAPAPAQSAVNEARGGMAVPAGDKLPQSGAVKPEYANSGRWIAQPN